MKHPVLNSVLGGVVLASIGALTAIRIQYMKEAKEDLDSLPYPPVKKLSWKNFFWNYKVGSKDVN